MDFKTLDTAFVTKLKAYVVTGEGYKVDVANLGTVPVQFDLVEEWWTDYTLPSINVRRVDLVPDPSRFLPGFVAYELSDNPDTPNTYNRQSVPSQPVTVLYTVELAADSQSAMNALLVHNMLALPAQGYGTTINAFGHSMPFRASSIRNKTSKKAKEGRKFIWEYTYAVEAWVFSTACVKVPQILQVDLTIQENEETPHTITVDENGIV